MSNGAIFQWGQVSIGSNSSTTVTLPTSFPSNFASVVASHAGGGIWQGYNQYTAGPGGVPISDNSSFQISNLDDSTITYYWIAIGY